MLREGNRKPSRGRLNSGEWWGRAGGPPMVIYTFTRLCSVHFSVVIQKFTFAFCKEGKKQHTFSCQLSFWQNWYCVNVFYRLNSCHNWIISQCLGSCLFPAKVWMTETITYSLFLLVKSFYEGFKFLLDLTNFLCRVKNTPNIDMHQKKCFCFIFKTNTNTLLELKHCRLIDQFLQAFLNR